MTPSAAALDCLAAHRRLVPAQDLDGSLDPEASYRTVVATGVACSAQCADSTSDETELGGVVVKDTWHVYYAGNPGLLKLDRIDVTMPGGDVHELYVEGYKDMAGRGVVWKVIARERL